VTVLSKSWFLNLQREVAMARISQDGSEGDRQGRRLLSALYTGTLRAVLLSAAVSVCL
jgi:hypothetical protein